ncbi:MAG: hypothetical protein K8T10_07675 [Candidatus Eremiobacteraeota bacterium]|nr:hypothetical protein [Candidatus Eremiobacteraeota bacterium]
MRKKSISTFKFLVVLIMAALILTLSCSKKKSIAKTGKGKSKKDIINKKDSKMEKSGIWDYIPHDEGCRWVYDFVSKAGNQIRRSEITVRSDGNEKIRKKDLYVVESLIGGESIRKNYFDVTKNEIMMYRLEIGNGGKTIDFEPPAVIFKYPPKKGLKWSNPSKHNKYITHFTFVRKEKVKVPAGEFEAWKVESKTVYSNVDQIVSWSWFAPHVGLVKQQETQTIDGRTTTNTLELRGYRAGKAINQQADKPGGNINPQVQEYFPYDVGDVWVYEDTIIIINTDSVKTQQENTYKVIGSELYNKKHCVIVQRMIERDYRLRTRTHYEITDNSVIRHGKSVLSPEITSETILKFPLKKGKKWENKNKYRKTTYEVVGQVNLEVPAGKFRAWKIRGISDVITGIKQRCIFYNYYTSGVGLVKTESSVKLKFSGKTIEKKASMELKEYHIIGNKKKI